MYVDYWPGNTQFEHGVNKGWNSNSDFDANIMGKPGHKYNNHGSYKFQVIKHVYFGNQ